MTITYDINVFRCNPPRSIRDGLQQSIAKFIQRRRRLPDFIVVEESQLAEARAALESINADLAKKFPQAEPLQAEASIGGCLYWEIWLGWQDNGRGNDG